MNILLQVSRYKELSKGKVEWNIWEGIKMVARNFKILFTSKITTSGNSWKKIVGEVDAKIDDYSLVFEDGKPKWIETPKEDNHVSLSISNKV